MPVARRVFISHIHEEAALAAVLRDWINDAFRGTGVTAFQSSDRRDLPAGRKWLDVVQSNLEGSEVLVAVLSPVAITRQWPSIELGAAWIRDIAIIPFCHSGIRFDDLGRPFNDFQGVNAIDKEPGQDLLHGIADVMKLEFPTRLHFEEFNQELRAAVLSVQPSQAGGEVGSTSPAGRDGDLPQSQVRILRVLAASMNHGSDYATPSEVASSASLPIASLQNHADQLEALQYIHISYSPAGAIIRISPPGSRWLEERGLMPE